MMESDPRSDADELVRQVAERLDRLEMFVSPKRLSPTAVVPTDNPAATVVGGIRKAERTLKRTVQENQLLTSFFDKYSSVEPLLETKPIPPGAVPPTLSTRSLEEMVLSADGVLKQLAKDLKAVDDLKSAVDVPSLAELPALETRLARIEAESREDMAHITAMQQTFMQQLADYNEFIMHVSELFVHYHHVLEDLEQQDQQQQQQQQQQS